MTAGKEIAAMRLIRTVRCALLGLVLLAAPAPAEAAPRERAAGAVTTLTGTATVARATRPQPAALAPSDDVFARDRISTAKDSLVRILLGGQTIVTARELSVVTIAEGSAQPRVGLDAGGAALDVVPVRAASGRAVEVRTPNAIAAVRGTVLAVEVLRPSPPALPGAPPQAAAGRREIVTAVHVLTGAVEVWASRVAQSKRVRATAGQTVEVVGDVVGRPRALVPAIARRLGVEFRLPARTRRAPAVARDPSTGPDASPPGGVASVGIAGAGAVASGASPAGSAPAEPSGQGGIAGLTSAAPAAGSPPPSGTPMWPLPGSGGAASTLPPAAAQPPSAAPQAGSAQGAVAVSGAPPAIPTLPAAVAPKPAVAPTAAPATPAATPVTPAPAVAPAATMSAGGAAGSGAGAPAILTAPPGVEAPAGAAGTGPAGGMSAGPGGATSAATPPAGVPSGALGSGAARTVQPLVTQPPVDSGKLIKAQPAVPK